MYIGHSLLDYKKFQNDWIKISIYFAYFSELHE